MKLARQFWLIIALGAAIMVPEAPASAQQKLEGQVLLAGEPVVRATVTLWAAGADVPAQVAQTQTGADGRFALDAIRVAGNAPVYLVAKGGTANAGANNAVAHGAGDLHPAVCDVGRFRSPLGEHLGSCGCEAHEGAAFVA